MDMHTDTTSHLATQAAESPARATAELAAAMATTPAVALPKASDFATLMDVYDARNDAYEAIEEGEKTEGYDATADQARADALAQIIIKAPCLTVLDAAAKIGIVNDVAAQGFPLDEQAANEMVDEAHSLIWRMAGGWRRGGDLRNIEEYEQAADEFKARYGSAFLAKGYRVDTPESATLERARYLLFASEPNHPLALAKMIAAMGAYEGYGDIQAIAAEESGLGLEALNVGLVGFVNAYRSALAMTPPPSAPESGATALHQPPGRIAEVISAITAKVRAFEAETFFPANKAHSAAEAAYFANDAKARTDEQSAAIDALNTTWLAAAGAREDLISEFLGQTPSTASEILQLANAFVGLTVEQSFFGKDRDIPPHQWMLAEEKDQLLDFLMSNLGSLAADGVFGRQDPNPGPADAQSGAWDAAKAAFEAANETMNIAGDALCAAEAAAKADLDAAGESADAEVVNERHGYKELEERWNIALAGRDDALDALLREPAPDFEALAFKAWHVAIDRTGSEFAPTFNVKTLEELAQSSETETSIPAVICLDLIRLTGAGGGSDAELITDINDVIRLHAAAIQKDRAGRPGAAGDYLDDADVPMQRLLKLRATTPAGVAARARLVEDWCLPVDILDREDLDWQLISGLIEDVKAVFGAKATASQAEADGQPELLAAE